ncbi:hypothetical protein, partial [Wenyingzhuangia sp. 2_MG-2023]|uniref:hypothetical protein n=1 Tax=Wenyingzhuangia sp. 2_MG-2023 TaxID=3062639 RepID=UPI0026E42113
PVLITRANLLRKTVKELAKYRENWRIPDGLTMLSYEALSRVSHASKLAELKPDLLIFDEVQCLKNRKAAVTKRVIRFMR